MADITHSYLHKWEQMDTLTWYPELRKYTFDVACKLLVGTDAASDSHFGELFEVFVEGLFSIPVSFLDMVMLPTPHPRDGLRVKFQRLLV
jgi:hypothetical protein